MEKRIKDRYSEAIYHQVLARYDVAPGQVKRLDGFESYIYEYTRRDQEYILRIGHSSRRSQNLIAGEVDWINYLADNGVPAARAVHSATNKLVEAVSDGQQEFFLATSFEKAPGGHIRPEAWNGAFFERYGRLIGRMHALSKGYRPKDPTWKRPAWNDPDMFDLKPWIPASETAVMEQWLALEGYLEKLPQDEAGYGLIHQDAHAGNFYVADSGQMVLFDFDDCLYSWFVNDIAIVLFYAVMGAKDWPAFTRSFMSHFLTGYGQENQLSPAWLAEIPYFLKLREIELYAVIHRSFDVQNLNDPWVKRYMEGRRQRIEANVRYIDCDFRTLEDFLTG